MADNKFKVVLFKGTSREKEYSISELEHEIMQRNSILKVVENWKEAQA